MKDLTSIREKINQMAQLCLSMLRQTFQGFIEHDRDILSKVLEDEGSLNAMERQLVVSLSGFSQEEGYQADKKDIMLLTNIVGGLEEIGDYIKDMVERIEIKIQEKLLFSEEAFAEYRHLYTIVESALQDVAHALEMGDNNFARRALCDGEHVEELVERFRVAHTQRLVSGSCDPRAGNMFLNLLDFTAQVFYHAKGIAKSILQLK